MSEENNNTPKITPADLAKAAIKKQEEQAREVHGAVNYTFIQLDQPRGWKGFVAKGLVNGVITTGCLMGGLAIKEHVQARKQGKLLSLNKPTGQRVAQ